MLRVNDWAPTGQFGDAQQLVRDPEPLRPRRRAVHGPLDRSAAAATSSTPARRRSSSRSSSRSQDECLEDTQAPNVEHTVAGRPHPDEPNTYLDKATLTITAGDAGCAGVDTVEYRVNSTPRRTGSRTRRRSTFDEPGTYSVDYRATDRIRQRLRGQARRRSPSSTLDDDDGAGRDGDGRPGTKNDQGYYISPATVTIDAPTRRSSSADQLDRVPRQPGGELDQGRLRRRGAAPSRRPGSSRTPASTSSSSAPPTRRATRPTIGERRASRSSAACTYLRSDEFDGTALDDRWLRHTRNGGTPTTGAMAPTVVERAADAADERLRDRRRERDDLGRPDQLRRPGPARARQRVVGGDPVHRHPHRRLAGRRPDAVAGGQQLLPLDDHPQPQRRDDLRRAVEGQPDDRRGLALAGGRQRHDPAGQGAGDDPHALRARGGLEHRRPRSTA